jgi:Mrp family chromosome partitioning ATPase
MRLRSSTSNTLVTLESGREGKKDWRRLGEVLVGLGALRKEQVDQILDHQANTGKLFGEASIEMGLVTPAMLRVAQERQHGVKVLPPEDESVDHRVVAAFDPHNEFVERIRVMLLNLGIMLSTQGAAKIVMVAGVEAARESALVAANLAVVCAQGGTRTLLVDANLDQPVHNHLFRVNNRTGVSTLLASTDAPLRLAQQTAIDNLWVIPAGPSRPDASALLEREQLVHRLLPVIEDFDAVVIECGSLLAPLVARAAIGVHGALIAVREHESSLNELRSLVEMISLKGVPQSSVVMMS